MQTNKKDIEIGLVQLFCTAQRFQIKDAKVESVQQMKDSNVLLTAPMFLSGIIFTFCTCPVVSNICRRISSVTLGSNPPTYSARLLGSGAARRTKLPEPDEGDIIPVESPPGEVIAVGMGFVFCGMTTGGSGGGGMCAGFP